MLLKPNDTNEFLKLLQWHSERGKTDPSLVFLTHLWWWCRRSAARSPSSESLCPGFSSSSWPPSRRRAAGSRCCCCRSVHPCPPARVRSGPSSPLCPPCPSTPSAPVLSSLRIHADWMGCACATTCRCPGQNVKYPGHSVRRSRTPGGGSALITPPSRLKRYSLRTGGEYLSTCIDFWMYRVLSFFWLNTLGSAETTLVHSWIL